MEEKNKKMRKLEALVKHRELQYLRVLDRLAQIGRRPHALKDRRHLRVWASERFRKLEEAKKMYSREKRGAENRKQQSR